MRMNVFYDFAEIILCIYAVVKHIFKRNNSKHDPENFGHLEIMYEILYIVTSLLIFVIAAIILLPFSIIRKIIVVYLKRKYGEKYCGLLKNMEALWTGDSQESKHVVNSIVFMDLINSPEAFIAHLKQSVKKTANIRFNSTVHSILCYKYRLYSSIVVDEVIRSISLSLDEKSNKSKFEEKVSKLANQSLPSECSFEVLVCNEPITFLNCYSEQGHENKYAIIVRFHHSVGDGVSILSYLLQLSNQANNFEEITSKLAPSANVEHNGIKRRAFQESKSASYINQLVHKIKTTSLYRFNLSAPSDRNILHGPTLSGQKIIVFEIDQESKYMTKIKYIKEKLKDCRFTDILYTAISASLFEHFYQHGEHVPKNIHMSFITNCPRMSSSEDEGIEYAFSAVTLDVPIHIDGNTCSNEDLVSRLEIIRARSKIQRQSVDSLLFYWMSRYVSVFPIPLLRLISKLEMKSTISFSNLPGVQSAEFAGAKVANIVFCTPNVANVGIGLSVHTYGGCLQIGLMADKALLSNSDQASAILQNVYKYIDLLDKEVKFKK